MSNARRRPDVDRIVARMDVVVVCGWLGEVEEEEGKESLECKANKTSWTLKAHRRLRWPQSMRSRRRTREGKLED